MAFTSYYDVKCLSSFSWIILKLKDYEILLSMSTLWTVSTNMYTKILLRMSDKKKLTRIQQKDKFSSCMKMEINILTNISKERNQTNERSINLKEKIYHH